MTTRERVFSPLDGLRDRKPDEPPTFADGSWTAANWVDQQLATDHGGPRRDMQRVGEPRDEPRSIAAAAEHVVADDHNGVDGLSG